MAFIFITGNSGSGKSSVRRELQRRGYNAYDTDDDGITRWHNKQTGEATERPDDEAERSPQWYKDHEWRMSQQRVEELKKGSQSDVIFLCGSPSNADDMLDLFDKVFCLVVDPDTLRHRIRTRTDHDYGKADNELNDILGWHDAFQNRYQQHGAIMIDATRPLTVAVDEIVSKIND